MEAPLSVLHAVLAIALTELFTLLSTDAAVNHCSTWHAGKQDIFVTFTDEQIVVRDIC